MSAKLTAFGQFTRKLRVDHDEYLKDMATRLGVTASYLSAVETGRRNVPHEWVEKLQELYRLSSHSSEQLKKAASDSRTHDRLDISHLSFDDKRLIEDIAKCLPALTVSEREQLQDVIKRKESRD